VLHDDAAGHCPRSPPRDDALRLLYYGDVGSLEAVLALTR